MEDDCDIIIIGAGIAAPLARYAARERVYPFCYWNDGDSRQQKSFRRAFIYPCARELLPQFHLTAPLERRITHESFLC